MTKNPWPGQNQYPRLITVHTPSNQKLVTRVHATGDNFENYLCGSLNCRLHNLIEAFIIQIEPGRKIITK